jgi:putative phosphoribosyl transferase
LNSLQRISQDFAAITSMMFSHRLEAGQHLARRLLELSKKERWSDPIVLALPRGGVPVAAEVARILDCPLDVFIVQKIRLPEDPEYGIGAITETGYSRFNPEAESFLGISDSMKSHLRRMSHDEALRRAREYRGARKLPEIQGRTIILVDDGIATGITAQVAAEDLRRLGATDVLVAVPVGAESSLRRIRDAGIRVISVQEPARFSSVGSWYESFGQLSDEDVRRALSAHRPPGATLALPPHPRGVVIFAHGSGSSRMSPRNRAVAAALEKRGLGTLLFDFLTESEALDRSRVFDIPMLADRLQMATQWLREDLRMRGMGDLPVGYFGASTGAAAALWAASPSIAAIVSRGGRPDLAMSRLSRVASPTLLIVGGADDAVLEMNREALAELQHGKLVIIPGATHLFEEPGALESVAEYAGKWFVSHFAREAGGKVA